MGKHVKNVVLLLAVLCMLLAFAQPGQTGEDPDLVKGYEFLQQKHYAEARAAFEAGIKKHPSNAEAHFYLAEACRRLKDWTCAEEHYETSVDLDGKSSVAALAKQRSRKAKVWRLIDESKQAISASNPSAEKLAKAKDTLDIAKKLGLDDEQEAVYQQLQEKLRKADESRLAKERERLAAEQQARQRKEEAKLAKAVPAQVQRMPMVLVPAGEFMMGSDQDNQDEKPAHRVYLDAFYMDTYEVTVGMYAGFLRATGVGHPPFWEIMNEPKHEKRPVVSVDWADAASYCKWAGKRLPTEAEWEKAARGTDGRTYPWGSDSPTRLHANFGKSGWDEHAALVPVGTLDDDKSPYGIYDMAGNVWEWVSDWYDGNYYKNSPVQNPKGAETGEYKVLRGGSWGHDPQSLRSAYRGKASRKPAYRDNTLGFRCAKTP